MSQLGLRDHTHQDRITLFVDVIVPVPIPKYFTYRVPFELADQVAEGKRVIIQFGRKKILTGIIRKIHEVPPKEYEAKYLLEILDEQPTITNQQLELIEWCASYYMSTPGEVLVSALPSGLKLSSQSFIQLNPLYEGGSDQDLSEHERIVITNLQSKGLLSYDEISDLLGIKNVYQVIKSLVSHEIILLIEQVQEKYQPKKISYIRMSEHIASDGQALKKTFDQLEKKEKQTNILLRYLDRVPVHSNLDLNQDGIPKSELLTADLSPYSLKTLIKNGILEQFEVTVSRLSTEKTPTSDGIDLSQLQEATEKEILEQFDTHEVVLFHGVTGSGKTEIYIDLIKKAIEGGGQVLYLLPEIALTTQIVKRLLRIFGSRLGIYHSKYSANERVEVWQKLLNDEYDVIVGVRSSVFLPFKSLSLVIVDEEHESSYKQFEQSPRYQARDVAIVLAQIHQAKTLLGSATPSFESYHNAQSNKYGLVTLPDRYGTAILPRIEIANLLEERKRKTLNGEFTSKMVDHLKETLEANKQAIVFQNRRGYSPYMTCDECAYVPKCQNCSVSLTYHMYSNMLRCHYCGYKEPAPRTCPSCGSPRLRTVGFGTEKIEEDLKQLFDTANIERMDLDTTRSKFGYQQIIDGFEKGEIDVLVGTQMVTKGLDFDNVMLVSVVDLDRMLYFPDFRSTERCFQLVTQVSGRAGRREEQGLVVIQTADPTHPIINHLISQDFEQFYESEIGEREKYLYPPFHRLIRLTFKNRDQSTVHLAARQSSDVLKQSLGNMILGPKEPLIGKIRNQYLMEILIKLDKTKISLPQVKDFIKDSVFTLLNDRKLKGTIVNFDVDPY